MICFASSIPVPRYDQRYSPDWWALKEQKERRAQYEADRVALHSREQKLAADKATSPNAPWIAQEEAQLAELRERVRNGNAEVQS